MNLNNQNRDEVIRMAREAGLEFQQITGVLGRVRTTTCGSQSIEKIEAFAKAANAAGQAEEKQRADALAATLIALRDIVTSDAESKEAFVARVRAVLGACPDMRLLEVVKAEREACAKLAESMWGCSNAPIQIAEAIRARSQQ